jgi:hypothetical protein
MSDGLWATGLIAVFSSQPVAHGPQLGGKIRVR